MRLIAGERSHLSRDIALRRLHFDDFGAQARQYLAAVGRGNALTEFQHPYAGKQSLCHAIHYQVQASFFRTDYNTVLRNPM